MDLQEKIVIQTAKPVISEQVILQGYKYYVKYWLVSGYSWDGDCMCTRRNFHEVKLDIKTLEASQELVINELKKGK